MSRSSSPEAGHAAGCPWHLLWVIAAAALAAFAASEFLASGKLSELLACLAWLCWSFSWYAKPFHIDWRGGLADAIRVQPLNPRVSKSLWSVVTLGALLLLLSSLAIRLSAAA